MLYFILHIFLPHIYIYILLCFYIYNTLRFWITSVFSLNPLLDTYFSISGMQPRPMPGRPGPWSSKNARSRPGPKVDMKNVEIRRQICQILGWWRLMLVQYFWCMDGCGWISTAWTEIHWKHFWAGSAIVSAATWLEQSPPFTIFIHQLRQISSESRIRHVFLVEKLKRLDM